MLRDSMEMRLETLKYIYRLSGGVAEKEISIFPAQIEGYFYGDLKYELRILQEKGFLQFKGNTISRKFKIALTQKGSDFIKQGYDLVTIENKDDRKAALRQHIEQLRI